MAKLYKNVSRFVAKRMLRTRYRKLVQWGLTLKPGDLINDCSAFNVRIIEIDQDIIYYHNGWVIVDISFMTTPYGGRCSLINCGVEPAKPRDVLEQEHLKWIKSYISTGALARWYGGENTEEYKINLDRYMKEIDTLESGNHITNERGMILKEFCNFKESFIDD